MPEPKGRATSLSGQLPVNINNVGLLSSRFREECQNSTEAVH